MLPAYLRASAGLLWIIATALLTNTSFAAEPFRVLSPAGGTSHAAVLLVPACSGFIARNGINHYEERASELQAAGYFVVFVDYLGRRHLADCAAMKPPFASAGNGLS